MFRCRDYCLTALLTLLFAGCGQPAVTVVGLVTLDGKPIDFGTVTFYPVEEGTLYYGVIDATGHYALASVDGRVAIEPGEYDVAVRVVQAVPSTDKMAPPMPKLLSPVKYADPKTSGFRFRLQAGRNTVDLAMISQ